MSCENTKTATNYLAVLKAEVHTSEGLKSMTCPETDCFQLTECIHAFVVRTLKPAAVDAEMRISQTLHCDTEVKFLSVSLEIREQH